MSKVCVKYSDRIDDCLKGIATARLYQEEHNRAIFYLGKDEHPEISELYDQGRIDAEDIRVAMSSLRSREHIVVEANDQGSNGYALYFIPSDLMPATINKIKSIDPNAIQ